MLLSKCTVFPALVILFSLFQMPATALQKSYIVYLGAHAHGPTLTEGDLQKVSDSHIDFLAPYLGSKEKAREAIFYSYRRYINGFAAKFDETVANEIAKNPNVVSIFLNKKMHLKTTHSWEFLSLENNNVVPSNSLWKKANFGEDIIIGNMDSGVWPESRSFSDQGYGPIPPRWKGICQKGEDPTFSCNRKLIGAKYFKEGLEAELGSKLNFSEPYTPRDIDGHGTHTLSIAGGNIVPRVSVLGVGNGTAKGGAPRARVAAYKVCWETSEAYACMGADMLKAFDHAIYDGVDVISVSMESSSADSYMTDPTAIGAMNAVKHGIVVVTSAGNEGPESGTVGNVAPWLITVGASTMDRQFHTHVELGNGLRLKANSFAKPLPEDRLYPLVGAAQAKAINASAEAARVCGPGSLDPEKVKGKIVVCLQGVVGSLSKGITAANASAVGMVLCNDEASADQMDEDYHVLPAAHLTYKDGLALFAYMNSTKVPMGVIKGTIIQLHTKPAPLMAGFSSKGPNPITPEILKPDITAPGVGIIAAYTEATSPTLDPSDTRTAPYFMNTGTSMSCPHVSGVVALLKAIYPKWSPAAIRSAIMTTATTRDNSGHPMQNPSYVKSNPFAYGAGHIRPDRAADPGLIYDMHMEDYLNFLCVIGYNQSIIAQFYKKPYNCPRYSDKISLININYPSITVPELNGSVTVTRTVKNVGPAGTYTARVKQPRGISVSVQPKVLEFKKTSDKKSFNVTLTDKTGGASKDYAFGALVWSDDVHTVRSPITVAIA